MIQAVVFDMDGVIIDSEKHWRASEEAHLARRLNKPLDPKAVTGLSMEGFHAALVRDYGLELDYRAFAEVYADIAREIYETRSQLMPGFLELRDSIRTARMSVGLASSSPHRWVSFIVARFALQFDAVANADDVGGVGKPDPAVYLEACRRLKLAPAACAAIEDSRNGVLAAKAAGMACVALRNGFNAEQDLSAADLEVPALSELTPKLLRGLSACAP